MKDPYTEIIDNKTVVINDYTGMKSNEMADMIETMMFFNRKQDTKPYLLLVDVTDCYANNEVVERFKEAASEVKAFADKTAVVGIEGIRKVLLKAVIKFSHIELAEFETEDEAKKWLVS